MRHADVTVNETPLRDIPYDLRQPSDHSIITNLPQAPLHIPLKLQGVISYFDIRKPTREEVLDPTQCIHVHMTSDQPWDPHNTEAHAEEEAIRASLQAIPPVRGRELSALSMSRPFQPRSIYSVTTTRTSAALDVDSFAPELWIDATYTSPKRKGHVDYKTLAKRWKIGEETAKRTIEKTTQLAVRDLTSSTKSRRLKPYTLQLKYPRLDTTMYADVLIGKCKSLLNNQYATVFGTDFQWVFVDPIQSKSDCHYSLDNLFSTVGIPKFIVPDNAKELTQGDFKRKCQRAQCKILPIEPYTPNMNLVEGNIREILRGYRRAMRETNTPECLWDCCLQHQAHIRSSTALNVKGLRGDVPATLLTGDTKDISYLAEFGWYDWVWHVSPEDSAKETVQLGRYCGPSYDVGEALCARVLVETGELLSRTSVFPMKPEEEASEAIREKKMQFTERLNAALERKDRKSTPPEEEDDGLNPKYEGRDLSTPETYEPLTTEEKPEPELVDDMTDTEWKTFDKYLSAKVMIPRGEDLAYGQVVGRKRDHSGQLVGRSNPNPLLDTAIYEIQFDDGKVEEYTANIVAESIYAQVDDEGYTLHLVDEIVGHTKDKTAVDLSESFTGDGGTQKRRETTRGWKGRHL